MNTFFAVFFLIKNLDDLWKLTLIMAGGTCISNAILWKLIPKIIDISS